MLDFYCRDLATRTKQIIIKLLVITMRMTVYILFGLFLAIYIGWMMGRSEQTNTERRLAKARDLRDRKVITEEEYESMRRKVILDA